MLKNTSSMVAGAAALAVVLAVGSAMAQISVTLRVDVPFEFTAGNSTMPAGEYMVRSLAQPYILALAAVDHNAQAAVITQPAGAVAPSEQARLVFHRHGDRYFLREIWGVGSRDGHRLPVTGSERELSRTAANSEVVAILAKR